MSKTKTHTEVNRLRTRRTSREMRFFVLKCPIQRVIERHNEECRGKKMKTHADATALDYVLEVK